MLSFGYLEHPSLYEDDFSWKGFQWITFDDSARSLIAFRRIAENGDELICVCNFQPVTRENYRLGVPSEGVYHEIFNTESIEFGGTGIVNTGDLIAEEETMHDLDYSLNITVPPLGVLFLSKEV